MFVVDYLITTFQVQDHMGSLHSRSVKMIIKLYALLIDTADTRLFKIPKVVICAEFFIQRLVVDSLVY